MPLGTEHSYGAGDIRAAAALADHLGLANDESMEFEFDTDADAYTYHYDTGEADYWFVEDHQLGETPSDEQAVLEVGGWNIFDVHPWGE